MGNCLPNPKNIVPRAKNEQRKPCGVFRRPNLTNVYTSKAIFPFDGIAFEALFEIYCIDESEVLSLMQYLSNNALNAIPSEIVLKLAVYKYVSA